ncbi:hypothetical protein ACSCB1_28505 [Streptomyces europaeiscabiei]|uniref:hypothetical protein n=1 Tax=Streptomyces europaeiscabiei TaxID=146819 RepID=UPI0006284299|nr:hypothetical protein [Streptomyces europaeiscabiei]
MARLLTAALGATVLMGMPATATAAESTPTASSTPEAYVAWLKSKEVAGDAGAADFSKQFQALSAENQEKFLGYINDKTYFDALVSAVDVTEAETETSARALNTEDASRTELANGDVVVESSSEVGNPKLRATSRSATHSVTVKYLGLEATRVTVKTSYETSGTNTTKVLPGSAWHTNYIAGTDLSRTPVDEWISAEPADNAHSETVWTFEWWTGIEDTGRHRVWADYSGYKGGYLKT